MLKGQSVSGLCTYEKKEEKEKENQKKHALLANDSK